MKTRQAWMASALPAVIIPGTVGAGLAAEIRARLERAQYTRFALLDRASYEEANADEPELVEVLAGVAAEVTGRPLVPGPARMLRFGPGDYSLVRHDRVHDDRPVELVLDVSAASVPGAEVHYRHRGQVFFTFPSTPGALAIVERGPTVMCNHTYVSKRHVDAAVVRLIMLLRGG